MSSVLIFGQAISGVTGTVTDVSGAVVPGARVTLTDTKTSTELTTTTNDEGTYVFSNVTPGPGFRLTFTAQGFQTLVINDVQLGIARTETHNAQLTAGQVSETVTVTSDAGDATLNTTDASVGNIIGRRQLRELPIQFRSSPAALIGLQPGAIGTNVGAFGANRAGSVTGARADQGNITVDGIDANDQTTGTAFSTVANAPIDSIQEFRAVTAGPDASEGRSSGGQIQLKTNSGTNEYHGSLREYFRTDQTAANSFFNNRNGIPRRELDRHQFGGSLGGPLPFPNFGENDGPIFRSGRDNLFFFFDFEGWRERSTTSTAAIVPLQHFREGRIGYVLATSTSNGQACPSTARLDTRPDCIGFFSPADIANRDPRNIGVNSTLLSFINGRYPSPNDLTGGDGVNTGLVRWNAPNNIDSEIYTARIDATPTSNQRLFGRLTITQRESTNTLEFLPGDGDSVSFEDRSYSLAGGHTWVINSNLTNVLTLGLTKSDVVFAPADIPTGANRFSGGPLGAPFPNQSYSDRVVYVPVIRDDLSWTTGSHSFRVGGSFKPIRQNPTLINDFRFVTLGMGGALSALNSTLRPGDINSAGTVTNAFDSAFTYLLGRIAFANPWYTYAPDGTAFPNGTGRSRSYSYNEYEAYVQDNWRVRNDLTLNLGVRYHLYPAPYERNGFQADNEIDFRDFVETRIANAGAGIGGAAAEPLLTYNLSGKVNDGIPFYETDTNNFAPRIGFAWNPKFDKGFLGALFGNGKTVLRGNYSKVYDRSSGAISYLQDQLNYIFDNNSRLYSFGNVNPVTALLNDPRFNGLSTLPFEVTPPAITRPFTPNAANGVVGSKGTGAFNYSIDKDFRVPYSHIWNLGVQRELPGNFLLDVSYVGRLGRDLFVQAAADQPLNFKDPESGQFMFDALNAVQTQLNAGTHPFFLTPQPWLENQMNLGIAQTYGAGTSCQVFGYVSCTYMAGLFAPTAIQEGGTAYAIYSLAFSGLLPKNVGMSSQFAVNSVVANMGESEYHGMLVSLQKRLSQGFEFEVNYTWSHSMDNQSSITSTNTGGFLCDITDTKQCWGDSDFDVRHLFNANYIWDLPFGRGRAIGGDVNRWADAVIGGWSLSGIINARSGFAVNSSAGTSALASTLYATNQAIFTGDRSLLEASIHDEGSGIQFFADPDAVKAALRYPRHGEWGSRNIFRTPSYWSMDMGLAKRFSMPWSEGHRLTLRVDAFNVFNKNAFAAPNLTFTSGTFGRITSSLSSPRELQFAIRYDF